MRFSVLLIAMAFLPSPTTAQTSQYQNDGGYDIGTKRVRVYGASQQYADSQLDLFKAVEDYQNRWVRLKDERELWLARYRIYENVISLRGKDQIMRFLDKERAKLGVSELEGYKRLGIHNPYADTSYIRYYDHKTGEPKISEVRGFYEELEKQRKDIEERRSVLSETEKKVNDLYQQSKQSYEKVNAAKKDLESAVDAQAQAERRAQREAEAAREKGKGSGDAGDSAGPYRLYTGAYSNTADLKGGGSGQEIATFAEARAKAEKYMSQNAGSQPSYRIEDKNGKVIEAGGVFKNFKAK